VFSMNQKMKSMGKTLGVVVLAAGMYHFAQQGIDNVMQFLYQNAFSVQGENALASFTPYTSSTPVPYSSLYTPRPSLPVQRKRQQEKSPSTLEKSVEDIEPLRSVRKGDYHAVQYNAEQAFREMEHLKEVEK
jgi:hypothetical protein